MMEAWRLARLAVCPTVGTVVAMLATVYLPRVGCSAIDHDLRLNLSCALALLLPIACVIGLGLGIPAAVRLRRERLAGGPRTLALEVSCVVVPLVCIVLEVGVLFIVMMGPVAR